MKKHALATLVSSAMMVAPLTVMAESGQVFVTPFVGVQHFDADRDAGDNGVWGIGGEYQFTDRLGASLEYARSFGDMEAGSPSGAVDYDRLSLDGIYYFGLLGDKFLPYFKVGVGHNQYDYHKAPNDKNTDTDAGLGVRIKVDDLLSIRAEAKAIHELDDSQTHGLYSLGLSYAFGGSSKPVEAPAPAPVVAAPAPVDSDGDGVTDDKDKCPNTARGLQVDADGCEFHLHKSEEIRIDIKFATNKADIPEGYVEEVERVAQFMRKYAGVKTEIGGHTDSTASDAYNQKLSQRRADAVRDMLINRFGIDAARLTAVGYGESKPIANNDTVDGRAENRRVVAVMHAETSEPVIKK